jgi:hypothetical protein
VCLCSATKGGNLPLSLLRLLTHKTLEVWNDVC